jgi:hypothetical protein
VAERMPECSSPLKRLDASMHLPPRDPSSAAETAAHLWLSADARSPHIATKYS